MYQYHVSEECLEDLFLAKRDATSFSICLKYKLAQKWANYKYSRSPEYLWFRAILSVFWNVRFTETLEVWRA